VSFDDEIKVKIEQKFENCLPKNLQKLKYYQQNEVLSIYKNSAFTIYDINSNKISFRAKNLPNDELDLKVEMWDTDILSLSGSINSIYTSTIFGEVWFIWNRSDFTIRKLNQDRLKMLNYQIRR